MSDRAGSGNPPARVVKKSPKKPPTTKQVATLSYQLSAFIRRNCSRWNSVGRTRASTGSSPYSARSARSASYRSKTTLVARASSSRSVTDQASRITRPDSSESNNCDAVAWARRSAAVGAREVTSIRLEASTRRDRKVGAAVFFFLRQNRQSTPPEYPADCPTEGEEGQAARLDAE